MPTDARLAELRRAVADPLPHPEPDELRAAADAIQRLGASATTRRSPTSRSA